MSAAVTDWTDWSFYLGVLLKDGHTDRTLRPGMTLIHVLAALNIRHYPSGYGRRRLLGSDGIELMTGTAGDVWEWLDDTNQYEYPKLGCQ